MVDHVCSKMSVYMDKEYFNDCKMLLIKAGSETYSFSKIGNTIASMRSVIQYQEQKIGELEDKLLDRDTDRDKAFNDMFKRDIPPFLTNRVKEGMVREIVSINAILAMVLLPSASSFR